MFRLIAAALACCPALAGCATCREHPNACGAVVFLAVAGITACLQHRGSTRVHDLAISDPRVPDCTGQPNGSCR